MMSAASVETETLCLHALLIQGHGPANLALVAEEATAPLETVSSLDQTAYVGRWYQVGR